MQTIASSALAAAAVFSACTSADSRSQAHAVALAFDFSLMPAPMYSAYDSAHTFRLAMSAPEELTIDRWELIDRHGIPSASAADVRADMSSSDAVLTTHKAGDFIVLAHSGAKTACADLRVYAGTPAQWSRGEALYGETVTLPGQFPEGSPAASLPREASCRSCHEMLGVSPAATAADSDVALEELFTLGARPGTPPPSGAASPTDGDIVCPALPARSILGPPASISQYFHSWPNGTSDRAAVWLYMRSLAVTDDASDAASE